MNILPTRAACVAGLTFLSGCSGVPTLYRPSPVNPTTALAPKVEHIVDRITCELAGASRTHLAGKDYVVTITLTLQVNDDINLTPSLTFVDKLATPDTTRSLTENLGIGGSRERLFTSQFFFSSSELQEKADACKDDSRKLYRLDGNLGLAEIVRDGVGIGDRQKLLGQASPPSQPSFASQVKFIVTRSVGAMGPTWSLVSFKGPGGANGLLSGKALTTDTLNIAFALKKESPPSLATEAQLQQVIALLERTQERAAAAEGEVGRRDGFLRAIEQQKSGGSGLQMYTERLRGARGALQAAERSRDQARVEVATAQAQVSAARAAAQKSSQAQSDANAIATGQSLITTMILQTLNLQGR